MIEKQAIKKLTIIENATLKSLETAFASVLNPKVFENTCMW